MALCLFLEGKTQAQISLILPADHGVTGVRQSDANGTVVITGRTGPASLGQPSPAFLYSGLLPTSTSSSGTFTNDLIPIIDGAAVTGGVQFYGPNTPYYDPWIGAGNILAVGAYKATTNSTYQSGVMYLGAHDCLSQEWQEIRLTQEPKSSSALKAPDADYTATGGCVGEPV